MDQATMERACAATERIVEAVRRAGVERLLGAATGDALERTHRTPMGELPGVAEASFVLMDVVVHGWDLAAAVGTPYVLDDDIAEELLAFVRQSIGEPMRGPHLGPAVDVAAGSPAIDQLVAFLGRTP